MLTAGLLLAVGSALATHYEASLEGSSFEIDNNANLVVNSAGNDDWASVNDLRQADAPTGSGDDSYSGGSKEDDACPGVGTGSIPNNKSDLLNFGVYEEDGNPGFMHLFWTRVQEPSGTTLMDFELNQSATACENGVNRIRTVNDLLIEYRIEQGGARAAIKVRKWSGTAWGEAADLTAVGAATGTINNTAIASGNSDGLGALSARTFGEASLDLTYVFQSDKCVSFGSAFLKSRASDSFTSQLKDYIAPKPISLTNCGKVIIRKETSPASPTTPLFDFTKSFGTDPTSVNTFQLADGGNKTFTNVLFGSGYTVTEDTPLPAGWEFVSIDCNVAGRPSVGVTPAIDGRTVTFSIDDEDDVLDCTYRNRARGTLVVQKVTDPANSPQAFQVSGTVSGSISHGGTPLSSGQTLAPGSSYSVTEAVPSGWDLVSASCSKEGGGATGSLSGSTLSSIEVEAGKTTTCTFTNRQRGSIKIVKVTDPNPDASDTSFTFTPGGDLGSTQFSLKNGGDKVYSNLVQGTNYSVAETVPAGWDLISATCDRGTIQAIQVVPGEQTTCTFTNRKRAQVNIIKVDDATSDPTTSNRLNGATLTLYTDVNNAPGAAVGASIADPNNCTTSGSGLEAGKCSIANIVPGTYWLVETTTPAGYATADPVKIELAAGANITRTIVDPRLHNVVVVVCHEGTNTLHSSSVTVGGAAAQSSITAAQLQASGLNVTQAQLCGLAGANFGGLSHGLKSASVDIGGH